MKIAIFHDFLIEKGGGERVITELLSLSSKKIIFTSLYLPSQTYETFQKIKIISMDRLFSKIISKNWVFKILFTFFFFRFFVKQFKLFIEKNIDVAFFSGFYSIQLVPFLSIPKVYYIQSEPFRYVFKRQSYSVGLFKLLSPLIGWYGRCETNLLSNVNAIIANSNYTKKLFEEGGVCVKKVVYPPVNTNKFYHKRKGEYFLFVGRLLPHKRVQLLLKVFSKIKKERILIVGGGPLAKMVEKFSRKYTNITFLGRVTEKKLRELYANCKAVIYVTEAEPFGIVPIEANAAGKPAIISAEGGLRETIVDKITGIIINKNYERNLTHIIKNFDSYKFSIKACVKHAKKFDTKKFLKEIQKVLHEIKR